MYIVASPSKILHSYGDITIAGGELQILDLNSPLCAFDQGGIFIVPHLLATRASVSAVSPA